MSLSGLKFHSFDLILMSLCLCFTWLSIYADFCAFRMRFFLNGQPWCIKTRRLSSMHLYFWEDLYFLEIVIAFLVKIEATL